MILRSRDVYWSEQIGTKPWSSSQIFLLSFRPLFPIPRAPGVPYPSLLTRQRPDLKLVCLREPTKHNRPTRFKMRIRKPRNLPESGRTLDLPLRTWVWRRTLCWRGVEPVPAWWTPCRLVGGLWGTRQRPNVAWLPPWLRGIRCPLSRIVPTILGLVIRWFLYQNRPVAVFTAR